MTREWQVGDLATAPGVGRALVTTKGVFTDSGLALSPLWTFAGVRPLVVVDPDNLEQVARLDDLIGKHLDDSPKSWSRQQVMQAALREFADPKPPRPDEPLGLGAVVEDEDGNLWVRDKTTTTVNHWKRAEGMDGGQRYPWSFVRAVRVLSEGVVAR